MEFQIFHSPLPMGIIRSAKFKIDIIIIIINESFSHQR